MAAITTRQTAGGTGVTVNSPAGPLTNTQLDTNFINLNAELIQKYDSTTSRTANTFLAAPNGIAGVGTFRAIVAADIPTLNQNTTGTAAGLSSTLAITSGGTGATTAQAAINALSGAVTSAQYLRGNGTNVVMSAIQAADVPTLNQNTTGSAASVSGTTTAAVGSSALASGTANSTTFLRGDRTWAAVSGGINYTRVTGATTLTDKQGVIADTSGGTFTVTLPATPAVGTQVSVVDGANWSTTNLTIARNASTIEALAEDLVLDIGGAKVDMIYDGTTWNVYAQVGGQGGTAVTLTGTQTLTNKTLTSPVISAISNTGTLTLPTTTDTLVGRATTDTLTNKTLTSPVISAISNTGTLTLPTTTDTLVGRATTDTLTNKTLTSPVISAISNTGTLTLPTTTDTLVGRATTDTLTNKTLTSPVISAISNTGTLTLPTTTDTLVGRATTDTLTNKTIQAGVYTTTIDQTGSVRGGITAVPALEIVCSSGNYFTKTIAGNSIFTVSGVPASRAYAFTLELTHTSGTVTWFSGVQWPGGTAPTLTTGKVHLFTFVTDDGGTSWRGASQVNYNS